MASELRQVLELSVLERSVTVGSWRAIRNGFWDDKPNTYRLYRKSGAGWDRILTAVVGSVTEVDVSSATPEHLPAIQEALAFWQVPGQVVEQDGRLVYRSAALNHPPSA